MLTVSAQAGSWVIPAGFLLFFGLIAFEIYRNRVRRRSLRRRCDGVYVWIEWHGGERCSDKDPTAPGGDWDSDTDGGDGGGD